MSEQRDKFLVEQEGGCWHETDGKWEPCFCSLGKFANRCLKCNEGFYSDFPFDVTINPDFSKWENMERLLELVEKKKIGISFNSCSKTIYLWRIDLLSLPSVLAGYDDIAQIPSVTATLIANVLGWSEEVKK